ncbi:hypothetical protein EX895_006023 [Sporisorium graminicola]|uniref:Uncharacterized protein n=1 Tax=Sporisorium graminicola TaxID=280036 RepID=A0A4U7KLS4_9BASI|nr:hypothetical protein EX895_006023 [Sporisorium graminicola]TKY84943.1 hypothetical protein EX895_006023 [Sporisorium graminicola]
MPRPRTPKSLAESRDNTGDESDATIEPAASVQTRRARKRPAHPAREGSADHAASPLASHSPSETEDRSANAAEAERGAYASRHREVERRSATDTSRPAPLAGSSAFETPNQARERLTMMQSDPSQSSSGSSSSLVRSSSSLRSARSTRSAIENRLAAAATAATTNQTAQNGLWRSSSMARDLSSQSFSSRYVDEMLLENPTDPTDIRTVPAQGLSQQADSDPLCAVAGQLTIRSQNVSTQPQTPSAFSATAPMARTTSNMSPPRPTRSLPRRRASARTQSRPLLSSSNGASSSYALRSRSTSSSNVLASSSSNANILASNQNNRQNSATGCVPLGGGLDPSYNPPSGMSTPRTPLAEIPLWLADMRSESRRSSTSSASFMDREDMLGAPWTVPSRHARTVSISSSSGPSSPGATRNGSTSPVVPFRRSLRETRPRQSDENARVSPSPSYFGEYDALPSPSASSFPGEMTPLDESFDPNTSFSSSMIQPGTSSPSTASTHLQQQQQQTSSPAMSTRSRTLNRAGSVRSRRLTNALNTPVAVDALGLPYEAVRAQAHEPQSAFHQARSTAQERRTRNADAQRPGTTLLERRAATAASGVVPVASQRAARTTNRPSSRTMSPAQGTRSSRRRSNAEEDEASLALDTSALGPHPGSLPPLQIPGARLARVAGMTTTGGGAPPTLSVAFPGLASEALAADAAGGYGRHATQLEPVSPSAFSEMTSLTQGSTASESMNSANGMPATPSSSGSALDGFALSAMPDITVLEAGAFQSTHRGRSTEVHATSSIDNDDDESASIRVLRQTGSPRKNASTTLEAGVAEDAFGLQLRPRP